MNPKNNDIMVYKANKLIEARYNLDLNEQKLILYAASKIDSLSDEKFPRIELSLSDFFNLIGNKESKNHDYMKDVAKGLMAKQLEIQLPNGGWELVQWVIKSTYEPNKGIVSFQFHSDLVPYLLKLGKHYKGYPLQQVMQLNSKYSIRLYELLIQWEYSNHKSLTIETNELKKKMGIQEGAYERFGNFENYVIKTAVSELNNQSNIFVTYEKIKVGRSIKQIKFRFEVKNNQNSKSIEEFRKLWGVHELLPKSKTIPLLTKEDKFSKYNSNNVARYIGQKMGKGICSIVYNTILMEKMQEGDVANFLIRTKLSGNTGRNQYLIDTINDLNFLIVDILQGGVKF